MKTSLTTTALFVSVVAATSSVHAAITQINYASFVADESEGFDAYSASSSIVNSDAIYSHNRMSFGKYFSGQQLAVETAVIANYGNQSWDRLDGNASGPLTLMAGAANKNLGFTGYLGQGGIISTGGPTIGTTNYGSGGFGCGSIAVMFDADVAACGLKIVGQNGGTANFSFFRRDGSLIGSTSVVLAGDVINMGPTEAFGFQSGTGASEIAGFSMWNTDPAGIGMDDFVFGGAAVPAPGAIVALGLAGLAGGRRRRA
jgi:hypothetical protein